MLEERKFTVYTDHKPLVYAFNKAQSSPRQTRHLEFISQFTTDIRYMTGKENVVADALSRHIESINQAIDIETLAVAQEKDEELQQIVKQKQLEIKLQKVPIPESDKQVYCDVSREKPRPYLTQPFRRQVFLSLHGLAHPGVKATVKLLTEKYTWKNIKSYYTRWAQTCVQCQRAKVRGTKRQLVIL